jgi:hypothetical protein
LEKKRAEQDLPWSREWGEHEGGGPDNVYTCK